MILMFKTNEVLGGSSRVRVASFVYLHTPNNKSIASAVMALLVDKHRPRSLDQLTYHKGLSDRLRSLVSLLFTCHQIDPSNCFRRKAETSPIFSSTALREQVRRRV